MVERAVREVPWESRSTILKRVEKLKHCKECKGTPRQEYQKGVIDGIRVVPTFNPYVKLNKAKRYVLDQWPSRNVDDWDPLRCYVRGSQRRYDVPKDIFPSKDELGEWHPPRLSGRYKADIRKQYAMHGLPWVWDKNFYTGTFHFHDREPLGPTTWYRKEFRKEKIKEAMRKMDELVSDYRQECVAKRNYDWFEKIVRDIAGDELAGRYMRRRKVPSL